MKNIIKWTCGIILILAGIAGIFTSPVSGIVFLLVGLFLLPPVLYAVESKLNLKIPTAGKWIVVLGGIVIAPFLGSGFPNKKDTSSTGENSETKAASIGIGQTLSTDYFDVTVNNVILSKNVRTGNEFADLPSEPGTLYLTLNITYKNTDSESRMITNGAVFVRYSGKEYEFDKAETILLDGWGLLLDQINPLTSKTTNIVYKIPAEIKGPAYYEPGRNYDSKRIYLGEFN